MNKKMSAEAHKDWEVEDVSTYETKEVDRERN